MVTIDLLEPYVNYQLELEKESSKNYLKVSWVVGGSKTVDETFIIYSFRREGDSLLDLEFENNFNNVKKDNFNDFSYLKSKRYHKTSLKSGMAIWSEKKIFTNFKEKIEIPHSSVSFTGVILFKVDQVYTN